MKPILAALALLAFLPAGAALADDDDCVTPAVMMPMQEAAAQVAGNYGWTLRAMEIDDGCYEVRAADPGGNLLKVKIDPATLDVLKARIEAFAAVNGTPAATPSESQSD
ncbi:PepSY domain-containing protein [Albidovulum sp.]|uniref:PepSY domain-containing protein n=1 Tax=Albidovulum sp. TaxID=1872424 RepID=UPI0039B97C04